MVLIDGGHHMTEQHHCFIHNIDVTVVDGICTTDCSIEECLLVDMDRKSVSEPIIHEYHRLEKRKKTDAK